MRFHCSPFMRVLRTYNPFKGLGRIIPGCLALVRYSIASENLSVCLSMFSAASFRITLGQRTSYEVLISNDTDLSLSVRLLVNIHFKRDTNRSKDHIAFFEKEIFLTPHGAHQVGFVFDWVSPPLFVTNHIHMAPDSFRPCHHCEPGLYRIEAVLIDSNGKICDKLTLVQELVR